jgi:hypothetical protein
MPLRDHFRPPVSSRHSWEGFHAQWLPMILLRLFPQLPDACVAAPGVHRGTAFEIEGSANEQDEPSPPAEDNNGGTVTIETDLPDQDEYEIRVYDDQRGRRLVAAIEIVSPSNKDRPESRRMFVAKCAALLQKGVCVSIVDLVTVRQFNLYADLLELIGKTDPALGTEPPNLYAVTVRGVKRSGRRRAHLDVWFYPLTLGQPLSPLPVWLDVDLHVPLDLEASYEDTCRVLRIS